MKMDGAAALAARAAHAHASRASLAESFSGVWLLLGNRTARRGHLVFYHKSASRRAVHEEICSRFADFERMLLASTPQYASFNFFLTSRLLKGGASHELVQAMSKAASLESFVAGATVLKAGEKPKSVYFVQRGAASQGHSGEGW